MTRQQWGRIVGKLNFKHGKSFSKEYRTWVGMKSRCSNPKETVYRHYGGRGISVCDRWKNSFIAFIEDMGQCPDNHELERCDNNGNYDPENCIWVDHKTNCQNKRNSVFIELEGKRLTVSQWANLLKIPRTTIYSRLSYGWSNHEVIHGRQPCNSS